MPFKDPEKKKEYDRVRRAGRTPEQIAQEKTRLRTWYETNSEKAKARSREWYVTNPEKAKAYRDAWREANADEVKEYIRTWQRSNPDKVKAKSDAWRKKNLDVSNAQTARYRARKQGALSLPYDRKKIIERENGQCTYCKAFPTGTALTIDHIIPLVRGGTDTEDNLTVACRSCNSKKRDKTIDEYADFLWKTGDLERWVTLLNVELSEWQSITLDAEPVQ